MPKLWHTNMKHVELVLGRRWAGFGKWIEGRLLGAMSNVEFGSCFFGESSAHQAASR